MARISAAEGRMLTRLAAGRADRVDGKRTGKAHGREGKRGRLPRLPGDSGRAVSFTVPLPPRPKERARTFMPIEDIVSAFVQARGSVGAFRKLLAQVKHRSFTPAATRRFEADVARIAAAAMRGGHPFDVPVEMTLKFVFQGDPGTWPVSESDGDLDNLEKAVKDALNKVAYVDDRLVVRKLGIKECGESDIIEVEVQPAS